MARSGPEVQKKARDKWYIANKAKQIRRQQERKKELKKYFREYKETLSCTDCGFSFKGRAECCDFHHLDATTKEKKITEAQLYSKELLYKELEKCIPLCANCHRIRHYNNL